MAPDWGSPYESDDGQVAEIGLELLGQAAIVCGGLIGEFGPVEQCS
jgi:hypothetical protein